MPRQALIAACTTVLQAFWSRAMPVLSLSQLRDMHVIDEKQLLHAALLALEQEGSILRFGSGSAACFCLSTASAQPNVSQRHAGEMRRCMRHSCPMHKNANLAVGSPD